jgi:secreted Zn-dependent insulinase-like peptidase
MLLAIIVASIRINMNNQIITSPNDLREYRYLELENGLKAVLVSDPQADKAAASLAVSVGSGNDPKNREGLAHFLEHMLFLGTEPFPEAGEYQAFISQNGGSHNAFTAHDVTNYFFDINNEQLEAVLDRFAPFFISPTFDAQYVERETNAVHAEYTSKSQDDGRRIHSAEKQAMNPDHPYSRFATGNLETLADRDTLIRDDLIEFYQQYYSADRMTLAIVGNYPLSQLENWVQEKFSPIEQRPTVAPAPRPVLYKPEQLPLEIQIEPIKEVRQLKLTFPMPESFSVYQHKPLQMLGHLLGHEGHGSLLALFKSRGWAEGLSAGRGLNTEWESTFTISIQLTLVGMHRIDEMTEAVFHYIALMNESLQNQDFIEQIYSEQSNLAELAFHYQEKSQASHLAMRLANNLRHVAAKEVIYGDYRWQAPNVSVLTSYLSKLTKDNLVRTLIAPEVTTSFSDIWYDTRMMLRPLVLTDDKLKQEYKNALHLPEANPFIPEDFALTDAPEQAIPQIIQQQPGLTLWYYPEQEFRLPKSRVIFSLQNQAVADSAQQRLTAQLFAHSVNEAISAYTYPAYIAGLNYQLAASNKGLELVMAGYQDKLPVLLGKIADTMLSLEVDQQQFDQYKAALKRRLENRLKIKPFERSLSELRSWLKEPGFDIPQLLVALENIQLQDIEHFKQQLKESLYIDAYVHGSQSPQQAKALAEQLRSLYDAKAEKVQSAQIKKLQPGQWQQSVESEHPDSAITLYIQGQQYEQESGIRSDDSRARYALLAQMLSSPYYKWLRTDKKLGYIVSASAFPQQKVPGLVFLVQSPNAGPNEIMAESEKFFADFHKQLNDMDQQSFEQHQQGLINKLTTRKKNMAEKASYFWQEINAERFAFDTNQAIADKVSIVTLEDIQQLFERSILNNQDPKLLFQVQGKKGSAVDPSQWQDLSKLSEITTFE